MVRAFIVNKIFSCSLILGASVHEKTWQFGPTVLPLKLDEGGGELISSRCVADLERWHTPAANKSCYSKTNRFSRILKQEPLEH